MATGYPGVDEPQHPIGKEASEPSVHFCRGGLASLPGTLRRIGARRVLVVASGRAAAVLPRFPAGTDHRLFDGFSPNPTIEQVVAGCAVREAWQPDLIIGIGGGSALDVAKAVRCLPASQASAMAYIEGAKGELPDDRVPLVLIPTTCGTGSEVTRFATVFAGHRKLSLDAAHVLADFVIVDPFLAESCPPEVTSSAAFDTLSHAVESYWSRRSTPESRRLAGRALDLLVPLLDTGLRQLTPDDWDVLAEAAHIAGQAIDLTRTTAAHAFAYRLTTQYGIPHGVACLLNLRWLFAYNEAAEDGDPGRALVDELRDLLLRSGRSSSVAAELGRFLTQEGWSETLGGYGITEPDLDLIIAAGLGASARASNNPRPLDGDSVRELVTGIL